MTEAAASLTDIVRTQGGSRLAEIDARIAELRTKRDEINSEIKDLLSEHDDVERLVKAVTPRAKK